MFPCKFQYKIYKTFHLEAPGTSLTLRAFLSEFQPEQNQDYLIWKLRSVRCHLDGSALHNSHLFPTLPQILVPPQRWSRAFSHFLPVMGKG